MSVKILPSAINDLADGRTFYEQQTWLNSFRFCFVIRVFRVFRG
jgi:hypothetical protein